MQYVQLYRGEQVCKYLLRITLLGVGFKTHIVCHAVLGKRATVSRYDIVTPPHKRKFFIIGFQAPGRKQDSSGCYLNSGTLEHESEMESKINTMCCALDVVKCQDICERTPAGAPVPGSSNRYKQKHPSGIGTPPILDDQL